MPYRHKPDTKSNIPIVFCLSYDASARRSERKMRKKQRRNVGGEKTLRNGQGWILRAQLGPLETGHGEKRLYGASTTSQVMGYGIYQNRLSI